MTGWIPDVVPDQTIESAWGNQIRDRTITPFPNAAARDAAIVAPAVGMLTFLDDADRLDYWTGTAWRGIPRGELARVELVANTGLFVTAPGAPIPGLFLNLPAQPAGRLINCAVGTMLFNTGGSPAVAASLSIRVNGTQIQQGNWSIAINGSLSVFLEGRYVATGAAMAVEVWGWQQIMSGITIAAAAIHPTFLQLSDIGST